MKELINKNKKIIKTAVVAMAVAGGVFGTSVIVERYITNTVQTEVQAYFIAHKAELKGDKGDKGVTGATGATGARGYIGQTGQSGQNGANGQAGSDGCTWLGWSNYYPYVDLGFSC